MTSSPRLKRLIGAAWRTSLRLSTLPVLRRLRGLQLRRLEPLSGGRPRGTPIVREYWSQFLQEHRGDIRGRALEIGTTRTIRHFGGAEVTRADGIDLVAHSPEITVVADLARADAVPPDTYDCFVNQFSMHVIADVESAVYHSLRILRPRGVLLANFPCLDEEFPNGLDMGTGPLFVHRWFTRAGVEGLLRRAGLGDADYRVTTHGNLFARVAYQLNMAAEELTPHELRMTDPRYPLLICVRAVKPADWSADKPVPSETWLPSLPAARWTAETGHHAP
jgi:SAM-dependent methyltransferase